MAAAAPAALHADLGRGRDPGVRPAGDRPVLQGGEPLSAAGRAAADPDARVVVGFLPASAADDADAVAALAGMINDVYAVADTGLWAVPFARTHPDELVRHVRDGELAVATVGGAVVGSVRVRLVDATTGEFGLLAAAPSHHGHGVGRELVRFAERTVRATGAAVMELELMRPRDGAHPAKDFLAGWYSRLGYRPVGRVDLLDVHPGLGDRLARPCDFLRYRKDLTPS